MLRPAAAMTLGWIQELGQIIEQVKSLLGLVGVITGFSYVLGLYIVNSYLRLSFHKSEVNLASAQYVGVGVGFLLFLAGVGLLTEATIWLSVWLSRRWKKRTGEALIEQRKRFLTGIGLRPEEVRRLSTRGETLTPGDLQRMGVIEALEHLDKISEQLLKEQKSLYRCSANCRLFLPTLILIVAFPFWSKSETGIVWGWPVTMATLFILLIDHVLTSYSPLYRLTYSGNWPKPVWEDYRRKIVGWGLLLTLLCFVPASFYGATFFDKAPYPLLGFKPYRAELLLSEAWVSPQGEKGPVWLLGDIKYEGSEFYIMETDEHVLILNKSLVVAASQQVALQGSVKALVFLE